MLTAIIIIASAESFPTHPRLLPQKASANNSSYSLDGYALELASLSGYVIPFLPRSGRSSDSFLPRNVCSPPASSDASTSGDYDLQEEVARHEWSGSCRGRWCDCEERQKCFRHRLETLLIVLIVMQYLRRKHCQTSNCSWFLFKERKVLDMCPP